MTLLSELLRTGGLGVATHGVLYRDVVARWGEPEAFAAQAPDPVYCLYGDLELGFTSKGRLWHMEIDHGRRVLSLPVPRGSTYANASPGFPGWSAIWPRTAIRSPSACLAKWTRTRSGSASSIPACCSAGMRSCGC